MEIKGGWRREEGLKKERRKRENLNFVPEKNPDYAILLSDYERFIKIGHVLDHKETLNTYIKAPAHRSYILWL